MCLDFIPALNKCESRKQTEIDSVYGDKERMKCEGRRRRTMYSLHVTTRVKNCSKNINKTKNFKQYSQAISLAESRNFITLPSTEF